MIQQLRTLTKISLVSIYLVILAGSIVRMTGSGMGCPDWPKCFGYWIPPTERSQLEWQAQKSFREGQIIIVNESLKVAREDFTTGNEYSERNWADYTKHDYARFNAFHTWTEYINRLTGAISGIPVFLLFVFSLLYIGKDRRPALLSLATLFMLGFEAWLGKLVVDGNLIPGSITIHMMGALVIVALLCLMLAVTSPGKVWPVPSFFRNLMALALLLTIVQIILGTQVREQIDLLNKGYISRDNWINELDWEFYAHRSLSLFILALNGWLWWANRKYKFGIRAVDYIMLLIGLEILIGVVLNYFGMPKFGQPLHLLLGTFLFGLQFYVMVKLGRDRPAVT